MKKNNTLQDLWVEMIQTDKRLTLIYFASFNSFIQAMQSTNNTAYIDFWEWYNTPSYPFWNN